MPQNSIRLRFHIVTTALLLVFILILTGILLYSAQSKFQAMAQDSAQIIFEQVSRAGVNRLSQMLDTPRQFVQVQSDVGHPARVEAGSSGQYALERRFIAALADNLNVYGYFVGLDNGDFSQVIGVRGHSGVIKSIQAPAGTWFAIRTISAENGGRIERWRFLDANRALIGGREAAAEYDPRSRTWYKTAIETDRLVVADPYRFASSGEIGITLARRLAEGNGVMAADVSIRDLNDSLAQLATTPLSVNLLIDRQNRVIAFGEGQAAGRVAALTPLTPLAELEDPYLVRFADWHAASGAGLDRRVSEFQGEEYVEAQTEVVLGEDNRFRVIAFAPMHEFSGFILAARNEMALFAGLTLIVALPLVFILARRLSHALNQLSQEAERIRALDLQESAPVRSVFHELDNLGEAQSVMKSSLRDRTAALINAQAKLENLIQTGLKLGRERDRMELLRKILFGGRDLLHSDAGTLYLVTERKTLRFALRTKSDDLPSFEIPLYDEAGRPVERYMATWCALHNEPVLVEDIYSETCFDVSGTKKMDAETGYRTVSMLTVPLAPREGEVIGVFQFLNAIDPETDQVVPFDPELVRFVTALAAQAAVALDNFQLMEAQKELLDALITLIAGAIDAKSPYTGGHCERVPELGVMLAEAASAVTEGPLAGFRFETEDEWREFRIGAWLHDCGKVTTPEYVVDKAAKLETIHNRIHEIRTRFEVLLRDAMLARYEAVAHGADPAEAEAAFEARKAQLIDDFAFVAECNLGGEFMAPDKIERLKAIAAQTWVRHFDDRLGLPHEELKRYTSDPEPLPAIEPLLADKPQHIIPRTNTQMLDPKWGFKINVPEHLYNYGELYNLSVGRGTLTEEERFKINEHVIQSLMMLEQLPLPKNLKRIPEYAGTHHETLIGTGYPRKLTEAELSVPMRIMAIADVFEALTASDRPYKKAKTLSEAIKILSFFKKDKHLDPDLFDLFLTSGIYLKYAERFLKPEQIDEVDIDAYVSRPGAPVTA